MLKNIAPIGADVTINLDSVEIDGVDPKDYTDFADAYVSYAEHGDGTPLTDDEIDCLNESHPDIAQDNAFESLL